MLNIQKTLADSQDCSDVLCMQVNMLFGNQRAIPSSKNNNMDITAKPLAEDCPNVAISPSTLQPLPREKCLLRSSHDEEEARLKVGVQNF